MTDRHDPKGKLALLPLLFEVNRLLFRKLQLKIRGNYKERKVGSLCFSPDGRRVAYVIERHIKEYLRLDGRKYLFKGRPCVGTRTKKSRMVLDGVKGNWYDGIYDLTFSPDSRRLAFRAERGTKHLIVVDGKETNEYDRIFSDLRFSPDGRRCTFSAERDNKRCVVVDAVEGPMHDWVSVAHFSPDSQRAAYWSRCGDKFVLVVDGLGSESYDFVPCAHLAFGSPTTLHTLAVRDNQLLRVEAEIANE